MKKALSDGDYTALEYNGVSAAFSFTSELSHTQLSRSLEPVVSENLRFLLVELSAVVSTSISQASGDWISSRLPAARK